MTLNRTSARFPGAVLCLVMSLASFSAVAGDEPPTSQELGKGAGILLECGDQSGSLRLAYLAGARLMAISVVNGSANLAALKNDASQFEDGVAAGVQLARNMAKNNTDETGRSLREMLCSTARLLSLSLEVD